MTEFESDPYAEEDQVEDELEEEEEESEDFSDLDDKDRDPLQALLDSTPETVLRQTLEDICRHDDSLKRRVFEILADEERAGTVSGGMVGNVPGTKRNRLATCSGCGKEFDESSNEIGSCKYFKYHPEEPEIDDDPDLWPDHDWDIHSSEFSANPAGYLYDCCDRHADDAPACTNFRHVAKLDHGGSKRVRA